MPNYNFNSADLGYFAQDNGCTLPEGVEVFALGPDAGTLHEAALRQAFNFLRKHDDGRYSSRMKMRVLQAAEAAETARAAGRVDNEGPGVVGLRVPFSYDDETEVKSGGILAVAVVWPSDSGRLLLAVHQEHRRQRLGKLTFSMLNYPIGIGHITSWVSRRNIIGQHFMLSMGMAPVAFNNAGGIQWAWGESDQDGDGVEDHLDPLDALSRNRARRVRREPTYYDDEPEYRDEDGDFR